jgi:hypothetical protein
MTRDIPSLFPEGTDFGDTNALPGIWDNWDRFTRNSPRTTIRLPSAPGGHRGGRIRTWSALPGDGPVLLRLSRRFPPEQLIRSMPFVGQSRSAGSRPRCSSRSSAAWRPPPSRPARRRGPDQARGIQPARRRVRLLPHRQGGRCPLPRRRTRHRQPFGTFYGPNITPDPETGIGDWTADDLVRPCNRAAVRTAAITTPPCPTRPTRA